MESIAYIHLALNEEIACTDRTEETPDESGCDFNPHQCQDDQDVERQLAADREYIQPYYPTLYL
jgi:hypothetical protein